MEYKENIRKMLPDELAACIEESTIHMADQYTSSPEVLRVGEAVVGTLGNFSASIGKAKSKKTFNVSAIVASALSNDEVLRYNSDFPSDKRNILYIDTEQGRHHCQKVLKRIVRLANLPIDIEPKNLKILALRKYTPEERLAIVEYALNIIPNIGLVIIDGIRDFVYDINSPSEATKIISKLMQWTDDYQIHIHTILHQNKNDKSEYYDTTNITYNSRQIHYLGKIHSFCHTKYSKKCQQNTNKTFTGNHTGAEKNTVIYDFLLLVFFLLHLIKTKTNNSTYHDTSIQLYRQINTNCKR